jgi:hypothetical protein
MFQKDLEQQATIPMS